MQTLDDDRHSRRLSGSVPSSQQELRVAYRGGDEILPIERSTKFTVIVNLKTAKVLGLAMPTTLLSRADEIIE